MFHLSFQFQHVCILPDAADGCFLCPILHTLPPSILLKCGILLESKKINGLAVSTVNRVRQLPDVPTGSEVGFDAFRLIGWNGIAVPSDLPTQVVDKWNEGIREMVKDPEFFRQADAMDATAAYLGPNDFSVALEVEYKKL